MYWRLLGGRIWVKRDKGKALGGENGQVVLRENDKDGYAGGMSVENVVYASERAHVVRCGECRWGRRYGKLIGCENEDFEHRPMSLVDEDWFCKDGKRGGDNGKNA